MDRNLKILANSPDLKSITKLRKQLAELKDKNNSLEPYIQFALENWDQPDFLSQLGKKSREYNLMGKFKTIADSIEEFFSEGKSKLCLALLLEHKKKSDPDL